MHRQIPHLVWFLCSLNNVSEAWCMSSTCCKNQQSTFSVFMFFFPFKKTKHFNYSQFSTLKKPYGTIQVSKPNDACLNPWRSECNYCPNHKKNTWEIMQRLNSKTLHDKGNSLVDKHLIHCQICKFSHLQRVGRSVIFISHINSERLNQKNNENHPV